MREVATTGSIVVTRTFTTDEAGAIVKMARTTTGGSTADDGTYLVVWNGHGDAVELSRIDGDGSLSPANRFTYDTWGTPTLVTVGTFGDLGFRYRYVGRFGVQWESTTAVSAGLLFMHARHYSPEIGRFLQPDPSAAEANLYAYAGNSPVTNIDPSGLRPEPLETNVANGARFEQQYIQMLRRNGWRIRGTHVTQHATVHGRPTTRYMDIVATKDGVTWKFELKTGGSRYTSSKQFVRDVASVLRDGIPIRVVRRSEGVIRPMTIYRTAAGYGIFIGRGFGVGGGKRAKP